MIVKWLLHLLVDAGVLLLAAKMMSSVKLSGFKTALFVALIIGVLSFLIGWLLTLVLNVATFGIFYLTGLGFVTRIVANAIVIEIADGLSSDFDTKGFMPSLILAVIIAAVGSLVDYFLLG